MHALRCILACGILVARAATASPACGDSAPAPADAMAKVEVTARKGGSELPYRYHLEMQHQLQRYFPPGPRLVDLWFRAGYAGVRECDRDAYAPSGGAVAIRSRSVDLDVPMRRGAYFSLPVIQQAYKEGGDIIISDGARPWLGIWWTLRVPPGQRMLIADILRARAQIASVQARISAYTRPLRTVKQGKYNAIKACFHDATGAILLDGVAAAHATEGHCKVLFNERLVDAPDATVEFSGPLDVVSFVDSGFYPAQHR